ncbi:MAG: hypothetical protein AAF532_17410 [Planctomycetota bacterium]
MAKTESLPALAEGLREEAKKLIASHESYMEEYGDLIDCGAGHTNGVEEMECIRKLLAHIDALSAAGEGATPAAPEGGVPVRLALWAKGNADGDVYVEACAVGDHYELGLSDDDAALREACKRADWSHNVEGDVFHSFVDTFVFPVREAPVTDVREGGRDHENDE